MPTFEVLERRNLTEDTFVLKTERPDEPIIAGQCFSLGTNTLAINREYSMYSSADAPYLEFLIRRVDDGRVSTALQSLNSGSKVEIGGPYGKFCLNEENFSSKKFLFIGTGTGIAPFRSFFLTYPNMEFQILHGIRKDSETYDANDYPSGTYTSAISQPYGTKKGQRVTNLLAERDIESNEHVYLCGNRSMIIDCISILRGKGVSGDAIFTETFF